MKLTTDLNTINLIWSNITGSLGDNIWRTHEYKYTYEKLNNLGSSFNQEVVNLKNNFYNSFNEWDQLNLMQLLLNYERYKELSSCYVCLIPDSFYKFRALDKATPEVIENHAIKNKGGGMSIFHPDYPSSIASDYLYLFVGVWEGQYEALDYAEREVEKLREDAINNLLNTTPAPSDELNLFMSNLSLFQDTKITFNTIWNNYENIKSSHFDSTTKKEIFSNYCAINLSHALLKSGIAMNSYNGVRCWGCESVENNSQHAIRAQELANWLKKSNINGVGNVVTLTGESFKDYISKKKGIVFFQDYWQRETDSGDNRTGDHIDLWDGNQLASSNFFFTWFRLTFPGITESIGNTSSLYKSKTVLFWEIQ